MNVLLTNYVLMLNERTSGWTYGMDVGGWLLALLD